MGKTSNNNPEFKQSVLLTGEKLSFLESNSEVQSFCKLLKERDTKDFDKHHKHGFELLVDALIEKNKDSLHQITGAAYSSILVYNTDADLKIHAGANIDPKHADHLTDIEHRNCAEKQAGISASVDELSNKHLDLMFLYRRPEHDRDHDPEKLVPCSDCARNYLFDLQQNNGKLVIILPDARFREFLVEDGSYHPDHSVDIIQASQSKIFYRIINARELPFLKIEKDLGSQFAMQNQAVNQIISLKSLNNDYLI